jgi:hypothetical protein
MIERTRNTTTLVLMALCLVCATVVPVLVVTQS